MRVTASPCGNDTAAPEPCRPVVRAGSRDTAGAASASSSAAARAAMAGVCVAWAARGWGSVLVIGSVLPTCRLSGVAVWHRAGRRDNAGQRALGAGLLRREEAMQVVFGQTQPQACLRTHRVSWRAAGQS